MTETKMRIAIAGHAGIGHVHCPGGLIQDDTAGFSVAGAIIKDCIDADTVVQEVTTDPTTGVLEVTTRDGGIAQAAPRRGITPAETLLMQQAAGRDALLCQTVTVGTMGRMYGQGVLETPSCLAAALANATLDTFRRNAPDRFHTAVESVPGNYGLMGGLRTTIEDVPVSVLATVNASTSGAGPNEDLEGNVALGSKRELMAALDMLRCPSILLEGKAYSPTLSNGLHENTFLVRVNRQLDNIVVAEALFDSARSLGLPVILLDDAFPQCEGVLKAKGAEVAHSIIRTAEALMRAERGADKVRIVAELARLVSEECGGMSFMTNGVHDVVRQVGMIPGTSAVLSMLVTRSHLDHWKIPLLEMDDVLAMKNIVLGAVPLLAGRLDEAYRVIEEQYVDISPLETLIG